MLCFSSFTGPLSQPRPAWRVASHKLGTKQHTRKLADGQQLPGYRYHGKSNQASPDNNTKPTGTGTRVAAHNELVGHKTEQTEGRKLERRQSPSETGTLTSQITEGTTKPANRACKCGWQCPRRANRCLPPVPCCSPRCKGKYTSAGPGKWTAGPGL